MATIKNVTNIDGKSSVYDFVGNSEETKPAGANIGEYSTFTELDTGNQFYRKGNTWATMKAPGGGSSGGGLPINFPTEGIANANKFLGFDANGNYAAKEGGSGGGQFVVTFSDVDLEEMTIGLPDKTGAEIYAAIQAHQPVVASLGGIIFVPLIQAEYESATAFRFTFAAAAGEGLLAVTYDYDSTEKTGINLMIPPSANDVAPLIVNLTLDTSGENPALVGDKTFGEILTAKGAGKRVMLKLDNTQDDGALFCMDVISALYDASESLYSVTFAMPNEAIASAQNTSDYFRYELS